jgi:antirestriction protein
MSITIYIACLSSYNNGFHFGRHFDLSNYQDKEDLLGDIKELVLDHPENPSRVKYGENPEEWAMHDIEGIDYKHVNTEWPDLQKLIDLNEVLESEGEENFQAMLELMDHMGFKEVSEAVSYAEDNFIGDFKDDAEMAWHIAEEVNGWDLSEGIGRYFNAEAFARDLNYSGDVFSCNGKYYWSR